MQAYQISDSLLPRPNAYVHRIQTYRAPGASTGPYQGFNLGWQVGDDPAAVAQNHALLHQACLAHQQFIAEQVAAQVSPQQNGAAAPSAVASSAATLHEHWLRQVHGTAVHYVGADEVGNAGNVGNVGGAGNIGDVGNSGNSGNFGEQALPQADAQWTDQPHHICWVQTADCLPVLLWDAQGRVVAAIHAGWRPLVAGIIEQTVAAISARHAGLSFAAWLGPAIGKTAFEVGAEVRELFCQVDGQAAVAFTSAAQAGKYYADLYLLARQRLRSVGVDEISSDESCTYLQAQHFFSYRRDGVTGRQASGIWLAHY